MRSHISDPKVFERASKNAPKLSADLYVFNDLTESVRAALDLGKFLVLLTKI
jgi:hypothetical protein